MTIYGAVPRGAYRQMPKLMPRSLGFERYTLRFNGVTSNVSCPVIAVPTAFTVLAYFKRLGDSGGASGDTHHCLAGYLNGHIFNQVTVNKAGTLVFNQVSVGGVRISDTLVIPDPTSFHQVGGMWDGAKVYSILDGALDVGTIAAGALGAGATTFRVGMLSPAYNLSNGLIPLILIYDRALSAGEIRWNRLNYHNPIQNGLVLWLPMEEGAGLVAADHSGLGNNGTLKPALTPPTWEQVRQYELRAQTE